MGLTARDIMQSSVVTVSPDDRLSNVQRLFCEEEIHGAPVVDDAGHVVGLISTIDLLRTASEHAETGIADLEIGGLEFSLTGWGDSDELREQLDGTPVSQAMTESVVAVAPDATIPEIARAIRTHGIHRVLVVEKDFLCGLVSTFDLVGLLEKRD